jgi:ABC-type dipeptide/oligopeptide/nickel transport system permease component
LAVYPLLFTMQRYLLSRIVQSIFLLFGVLVMVFFMVRLTGDPARLMMPREASPADVAAFRAAMGLDRPLPVQFWEFMRGAVVGDFGNSLHYRAPAMEIVLERLPATLQLAVAALTFALMVALPLGVIGGANPGSVWDFIARTVGLVGQTVPNFWLALLLILFFSVNLGWFPTFGRDGVRSVILPAVALGFFTMGQLVRLTRSAVLEIRGEDYIRTAYSKGLPNYIVYTRHIFRNAAIPLVSILGVQFGYLLSGSIYIETIFAWPGLGRMIAESVAARDYPLVQAIAFLTSAIVVVLNLLTDVAYALIDPRIRYGD